MAPCHALEALVDTFQTLGPVDLRFASTQEIQIRAVKNQDPRFVRSSASGSLALGHGGKFAADTDILSSVRWTSN